MKYGAHAAERDPHTRPLALADLPAAGHKQSLNVSPGDASSNRRGEYGFKGRSMRSAQPHRYHFSVSLQGGISRVGPPPPALFNRFLPRFASGLSVFAKPATDSTLQLRVSRWVTARTARLTHPTGLRLVHGFGRDYNCGALLRNCIFNARGVVVEAGGRNCMRFVNDWICFVNGWISCPGLEPGPSQTQRL